MKAQLGRQKRSHERLLVKMGDQLREREAEIADLKKEDANSRKNDSSDFDSSEWEDVTDYSGSYGEYIQAMEKSNREKAKNSNPNKASVELEFDSDQKHAVIIYPNGEKQRVRIPVGVRRWKADLKEIFSDSP